MKTTIHVTTNEKQALCKSKIKGDVFVIESMRKNHVFLHFLRHLICEKNIKWVVFCPEE